eukprot:10874209-Prorocentrum_lima.AAC.1
MRHMTASWHRPRGMPPPLPHDLEMVLEGVGRDELEARVTQFLEGTLSNMESRGYTQPPVYYQMPAYYLKKDARGA